MRIIVSPFKMQALAMDMIASGVRVGLVPTMGFLHAGHLSLVRRAGDLSDLVVVSSFVNPVQFGPGEDLDRYPRSADRDDELCRQEGVDVVFRPDAATMYGDGYSVYVEETLLSRPLCGKARPTHFRGVATVVAKLFNIVRPAVAVFGQKDAQQVRVIQRMARDLNFPVEIVVAPIVRETDGLAMSSRNKYLSAAERAWAPTIYRSLQAALADYEAGTIAAATLRGLIIERLRGGPGVEVDYVEVVDWNTLQPVPEIRADTLVAVAVRVGDTRLIDNILIRRDIIPAAQIV